MARDKISKSLRYAMCIPIVLLLASIVACCMSYSYAKARINDDLNLALASFANAKSEMLCQPDTIAAIKSMDKAVGQPICYRASDLDFANSKIADKAYYTLRLADAECADGGHFIVSDSILLNGLGTEIELKGYVDCNMATVFSISDQSLPGALMALSALSMMCLWFHRQRYCSQVAAPHFIPDLANSRLTPMQRQLVDMILAAPDRRASKRDICFALWGNKSNAEESLYTLVRRSKQALAEANFEIICNRGDSYEIKPKC